MKNYITILIFIAVVLGACSTDKETAQDTQEPIIGEWVLTELKVDQETASDSAKFGKEILDQLAENNCVVLTFTFNADLTASAENSAKFLQVNAGASGLEVPCPTQSETKSSTYTFDGSTLTTIDEAGASVSARAIVDGNTLAIIARDLDIPNFNDEGELIFIKK